jgi:hypothetical protein
MTPAVKIVLCLRALVPALALCLGTAAFAAPPRCERLEEWLPEDVIGFAKVRDAGKHLRAFLGSKLFKDLESTRAGQFLKAHENYQKLEEGLEWFESASGRKPLDVFDELFGREVVVGLKANLFVPTVVVLSRTAGEKELASARKAIERAFQERAGFLPTTEKSTYQEYTVEKLDKAHFTQIGDVLVVSSGSLAVEEVIDLAAGKSSRSVKNSSAFQKAFESQPADRILSVAVRPQFIPNIDKLANKADNALASLLIHGWTGALSASDLLTAGLDATADGLKLKVDSVLSSRGLDKKYASFFPSGVSGALFERLQARGVLGAFQLHRDLASWWETTEDLLQTHSVGELAQFTQVMSLVFEGKSFEDEVLPKIGKTMTFVAANQAYGDLGAKPLPVIPGFGLVFAIEDAKNFGRSFEVAFNSLVAIINLDRMQKKKDGRSMLVRPENVGATTLLTVDLGSAKPGDERPGIECNFSPSLAVVGDRVILSSSKELGRMLIEEIEKLRAAPAASGLAEDALFVTGPAAAEILAENRDPLASETMKKEGISLEEARARIDALVEIVKFSRDLRVRSALKDGTLSLEVGLRFQRDRVLSGGSR